MPVETRQAAPHGRQLHAHCEAGLDAGHVWQPRQFAAVDALVILDIAHKDNREIVVATRHQNGAALKRYSGGRGLLLGGVPGVSPARVAVIGGGMVGTHAARMAAGLGAEVSLLDRSIRRLRELDELFEGRVRTRYSTMQAIQDEVFAADVVIGTVLVPGASAPKLVTRAMLSKMQKGAVLVDVAIDQGGCFETSHATTHADPTYEVGGIIHYCVANMPGAVLLTSSHALNNATLPFGLALAAKGIAAVRDNPHLLAGLNVLAGRIVNKAVADSLGMNHTPFAA
ncbi:NAD-binding protein [Bradyrhizobium sp. 190]|nr:NAD-binding protein [Bradyrhizobium sp. 190]